MNLYEEYYKIRHDLDTLQVQEQKLKELIIDELAKNPEPTLKTDFGNFTRKVSKKYSFSTNIAELSVEVEKQVKEFSDPLLATIDKYAKPLRDEVEQAKQKEIDAGIAKEQTTITMAFAYKKEGQ